MLKNQIGLGADRVLDADKEIEISACVSIPEDRRSDRKWEPAIRDTIAAYGAKLREAQADLAHVNAVIRLFAATGEPADFPPYIDLNRVFRRGETTQFCLAALRACGPLDTRQLTGKLMASKGLDSADKVMFATIALRVVQTLRVRAKRGQIDGTERRKGVCVWKLSDDPFESR